MSEFSESYHLRGMSVPAVVDLVRNAETKGYVFPPKSGWTTFVVEGDLFAPNPTIIRQNPGLLLYFMSAEDHGWSFALFDKQQPICAYSCSWDDDIHIDDSLYSRDELLRAIDSTKRETIAELERILFLRSIDEVFDAEPSNYFAKLMQLPRFEWTSFSYAAHEFHEGSENSASVVEVS